MGNRFEHLKKSAGQSLTKDEFINGAESEDEKSLAKKPKPSTKDILLSVSGRINREKKCNKPVLVYLKKDIEEKVKKYCHGNKTLIINYLIDRGLEALIQGNELVLHLEDD